MKFTSEEVVSLPSYTAIVAPLTFRSTRGLNAALSWAGTRRRGSGRRTSKMPKSSSRNVSWSLRETREKPVLTPPNRQRRKLSTCGPLDASTRDLATDNGKPLHN